MDIRATQDRVLVEPRFAEQTSLAGIYLGEGEMLNEGTVLAVGPGLMNKAKTAHIPVGVNVGDTVVFVIGAGAQTTVGRNRVLVLRESDVLAVQE